MGELPPFALLCIGGLLAAALPSRRQRAAVLLLAPALGWWNVAALEPGAVWSIEQLGHELVVARIDRLSLLFSHLFHLSALLSGIFSLHVRDRLQHAAGLVYAGTAVGAVVAGDWLTLFLWWEAMALSSAFLVWARRTPSSSSSGLRYLALHALSGMLLLAGGILALRDGGSLAVRTVAADTAPGVLLLLAFGLKAAFPLLHNWLTDAYPNATATGTVWLSACTTKVAVYALARTFPGLDALVWIGAVMTCFPIFYAVIENDLRRVLGYSMINQLGFMVCGVGLGTELAVNGAVAHAFNDVIFKGLLFMAMGAVLHRTGRTGGNELGGLWRSMPWTTGFCIVGAASISAFPLFSGFVSKSMVMAAALEEGHPWIWLALLFASAGVFHHAGIKIPYFAFFAHDSGLRPAEAPLNMRIAMGLAAALCIGIGCFPGPLYSMLPYPVSYSPYDATHVIAQLQLLFFSALAFTWLQWSRLYPPELPSVNIDAEWVYRKLGPRLWRGGRLGGAVLEAVRQRNGQVMRQWHRALLRTHGPHGTLAVSWPTGSMMLWVVVLLAGYLIMYYVRQ